MTIDAKLSIHELRKTYDPGLFKARIEVLKGLSLEVRQGEVFGFLGPNGAGKTTTIKAIVGLIRPDAGEITVCGLPHGTREAKQRLGFMPESPYFYHHLSGRELLRFHSRLLGLPPRRAADRVDELLARVGMSAAADTSMVRYSKGMQQRISLAQALLGEPELLILDEPMSGLDPVGRRDVRDLIVELRGGGTTVFFSSHIIPDVETLCDRVAIVHDGVVGAIGSVRDLVARQSDDYEATFVGADPTTLSTPVEEARSGSDAAWVRVAAGRRDALVRELSEREARLVALTPVRSTLEELVVRYARGEER